MQRRNTTATTRSNYYVPGLAPLYSRTETLAYPLIRIAAGLFLVPHGMQKLFGMWGGSATGTAAFFTKIGLEPALPLAYLVGAVEFFGGILIAIGLFTRPAALAAAILLTVAAFKVHLNNGFFWTAGGYEYPLMWALVCYALVLGGSGRMSVDGTRGREF